jgi:hypothetical protein
MKLKPIFTWDGKKARLFRVIWNRGRVGDGKGYSAFLSLGLTPRLAAFSRIASFHELRITLLGLSLHYRRSYGGYFV